MRTESGHHATGDGVRLPSRAWLPDQAASERALVVVAHGLGEHIGRYDALATRLVREGFAVRGYDQRGHGYAPGARANIDRFERFSEDLGSFTAAARAQHPGKPMVLLGHSMGGVVAARAVQMGVAVPNLLVLSAPAFRDGTEVPGWARRLLTGIAKPFPGFPTVRIDSRLLSRDPAVVAAYDQDPAVFHGPVKARMASEMVRAGAQALREGGRLTLPLLIVHGKSDGLIRASGSAELMATQRNGNATFKLYDEAPHELFNDPGRERVIGDLLAWLDAQLSSLGAAR
jgi:acylglycerol lipase